MSAHAAAGDPPSPPDDPGETRWTGTADDIASLSRWLTANGVDSDAFGEDGAKSLVDLAVARGSSVARRSPASELGRGDARALVHLSHCRFFTFFAGVHLSHCRFFTFFAGLGDGSEHTA